MLAHHEPSAFSCTMSATTAQRSRSRCRTRSCFQRCCAVALKGFRPGWHSCRSEPDSSGEHISLGLPQAASRSER
jgi:hypothetical protein